NILISRALAQKVFEKTGINLLLLLPSRKIPPITFYGKGGFSEKNSIFSVILSELAQNKSYQIKKIPWILGLLVTPKIIIQFLPWEGLLEQFLLIWQKLFRETNQKGVVSKTLQPKNTVFVNWGDDLEKHTTIDNFLSKTKSVNLKFIHLFRKKKIIPDLPKNHHIFYKKPLRYYLIKNLFSISFEMSETLSECFSIIKNDTFFQRKFYTKDLFFAYFYLYFYGTAIIESYRRWLIPSFNKFSPKLLITSDIHNCIGRIFIFTAKEFGAKVYTFSHGCPLHTPWLDPINNLGDKVLVSGSGVAVNIQKAGIPEDRIVVVGDKKALFSPLSLKKEGQKTIAIITSMKMDSWIEPRNLALFFKTIEALVTDLLKADFKVIIKSHKIADYFEFYESLLWRYKNYPLEHTNKRWSAEELASCHAAIFPGGVSTIILDCQKAGVPVVYIDILSKIEKEILRHDYKDCGAVVKTSKEAVKAVGKLFTDREYLENTLELGRRFYNHHVDLKKDFIKELAKLQ
ncbi:MAG TPA: hypothetical protein QGH92_02890, partial [Candidatus Parcubacteria bacterium]|nr:hypothetical protein [Candidatus Parcubacteria bacterium]